MEERQFDWFGPVLPTQRTKHSVHRVLHQTHHARFTAC
jgi:hypothetical protein